MGIHWLMLDRLFAHLQYRQQQISDGIWQQEQRQASNGSEDKWHHTHPVGPWNMLQSMGAGFTEVCPADNRH